ncbi:MAG: lipoyl(octanoyl) transferase LipB [Pseudomonadota bacterium]|nr:lipoyl(octanoyl) transferase LipB [Pseudomonadota bacterium]
MPRSSESIAGIEVQRLGLVPYETVFASQAEYTSVRSETSSDQVWLVEHPAVFTMGQAAKAEHILAAGDIPIVQSDRGGQVTYHGPGQTVVYYLLDLKRLQLSVRDLVTLAETVVIDSLAAFGIRGETKRDAPGVYVNGSKIAALGFRIRKGCSYHGLSLNRAMDLEPFTRINPCGFRGLKVTDVLNQGVEVSREELEAELIHQSLMHLSERLSSRAIIG